MPSYRSSEPAARQETVDPGEYEIEIINAEEATSQKGSEMIELKLCVPATGTILFDHLIFIESCFWKIDTFRAAIGELVIPDEDVEIHADDLIGRTARVRLILEEYKGRKRNKVVMWLPPKVARAGHQAAAPARASSSVSHPPQCPTAAPSNTPNNAPEDDNIPF